MAAALLVAILFAVSPTALSNVHYVIPDDAAGHEPCPTQPCYNLSHYISQPGSYFTSNNTIIFLKGVHSLDREYPVNVSDIHNLILMGQGQWPVVGAEDTVMQSTVTINCTRGRGGFRFTYSHNITVEGLTVINCGGLDNFGVFDFNMVNGITFHKNSIQHMTGNGLFVLNCDDVIITNCSYYHSALCDFDEPPTLNQAYSGVAIFYTTHNAASYSLDLLHSNMTKCCSSYGGGISLIVHALETLKLLFDDLKLSHNKARSTSSIGGGGMYFHLYGTGSVTLVISNCVFFNGTAVHHGGGMDMNITIQTANIAIYNTEFINNNAQFISEIRANIRTPAKTNRAPDVTISLINSTINTKPYPAADYGVVILGCCAKMMLTNTSMRFANVKVIGVLQLGGNYLKINSEMHMDGCRFIGSYGVPSVVYLIHVRINFTNCVFSNNSCSTVKRCSVVTLLQCGLGNVMHSCIVSDNNNMTGIVLNILSAVNFTGHNLIQNNRNTDGAGIKFVAPVYLTVDGELHLNNNTADGNGGAILVIRSSVPKALERPSLLLIFTSTILKSFPCTIGFNDNSSSVIFSGNRAGKGGSDIYGASLMDCNNNHMYVPHIGQPNETSWYFDTPLMKYFNFSGNTDRLSSMSSDPIMVCFCNTTTNLPNCSDRTHHIQTYPGLEINTSIATVGRYGGTSPGTVQVTARHATLVRHYGQIETTNCFQLHILLQNTSSTTALVDIQVIAGQQDWGVFIGVEILECPIGFTYDQTSGQCQCDQFLETNNVQCNMSTTPDHFLRSGNSWFAYINNTQCITGTTNCPFDYCNRSNVSFDIMAPDRQCLGNRTGILCGQCQSHLSIMLGSNRCSTCSNWYLFLLPVFALAGIALVAVLMFLNLSVSVGTINGLLFYANMVKLNEAFFFPYGSIPVVSQFIAWLNLDLGIEVCLFDGLDGYWNTWLQFVFPAYLFLLMGGIIVGSRYSVWICRLCGSHDVSTLATLFLMSYTKILLSVTNSLSWSQLPCNDSILTVWSVDGNIEYGSGKHLILVVFSCGVLVIGLAYPVLVLCSPLLERYSHKCIIKERNPVAKFKPLLDAYRGPYKDKYRFWTGVTLMVRLALTVTFAFSLGDINAYIITTVVVGILTSWSFTQGVYKKIYLTGLEAFYLVNIFLLSIVSLWATGSLGSTDYPIATIISVCLSFVVCLLTMATHVWWKYDFKIEIMSRLWFGKQQPECIELQNEEEGPPPGSPPSIVYGSHRGEHQFVLEFPCNNGVPSSPVLLKRESLLFD